MTYFGWGARQITLKVFSRIRFISTETALVVKQLSKGIGDPRLHSGINLYGQASNNSIRDNAIEILIKGRSAENEINEN